MNPFDDDAESHDTSSSYQSTVSSISEEDGVWQDIRGPEEYNRRRERGGPALQFNNIASQRAAEALVSPLANALVEEFGSRNHSNGQNDDEELARPWGDNEESPLLSSSQRGKSTISSPSRLNNYMQKYKTNNAVKKSRVLTKLDQHHREDEAEHADYKMIRLENVGTAKSWLILLLPYFAVILCLISESNSRFQISMLGPLSGETSCYETDNSTSMLPNPTNPCSFFLSATTLAGSEQKSSLSSERAYLLNNNHDHQTQWTVFDSGVITSIPPSVSVLFADATFTGLSLQAMTAIYHGRISVSGLLLERDDDSGEEWNIVATSNIDTLAMACHPTGWDWTCHSPKLMEILLYMPGSAILSGNDLRINILYSYNTETTIPTDRTYIFGNDDLFDLLDNVKISEPPDTILAEVMKESTYSIYHTNPLALRVDIWGRLVLIAVTIGFGFYWLYMLGCQCCCSCARGRYDEETFEVRQVMTLLDSPWVSFPERWYILVMIISLVLIQGPLVVLMYFNPALNTMISLKTLSDTFVGVGVNGVLFGYLCLFQGFGHHTAKKTRQWMHHQRKMIELRRAAKYVVQGQTDVGDSYEEAILRYIAEHFDLHGDTDGTLTLVNLRLFQDPFGHDWADFLLPKLLLFCFGVGSIWLTAYTRFHFTSDALKEVSQPTLQAANSIYLLAYLVHFSILIIWLALIFRSSMRTGEKLRREPFLATRAAQLAYRVLFVHITLGFLTLTILSVVWLEGVIRQWRGGGEEESPDTPYVSNSGTLMDFWLQTMDRILQRFPYSGTASSIGIGRISFATVSILIAAFVFLPHDLRDDLEHDFSDDNGAKLNREEHQRQRRDKRAVVSLVGATHTWRVLPLPMERTSAVMRMMLPQKFYQLYRNGRKDFDNMQDAGIVCLGQYIPVFCVELACWLQEASFQAYYSPKSVSWNDSAPGKMNLASIGLRLESAVFDHATNTQAIIATNSLDQSEGLEDSIIVVAFRGSVDAANIRTDLKSGMVALPDQLIGFDKAPFRVSSTGVLIEDSDGWMWNAHASENHTVSCYSASGSSVATECFPFGTKRKKHTSAMASGAMAVLSATPIARNTLPCVHEGFNEVYSVIRKQVIEAVLPVLQRQLSKVADDQSESEKPLVLPKIFVTGHSLGGALAQLFSLDLASNCDLIVDLAHSTDSQTNAVKELFQLPTHPDQGAPASEAKSGVQSGNGRLHLQPPIACYTFGQPRVGNRAFATLYKQRVPHTFRVAVEGDPITALPQVACSGIYKPAGLEVLLDEGATGNILVGPTIVETLFRFHNVRTDFAAHSSNKYRDCLESALLPHELQEYYRGHSGDNTMVRSGYGAVQSRSTPEFPDWMTQGRSSQKRL